MFLFFFFLALFVFGLCVGSFLNVVVYRSNTELNFHPRGAHPSPGLRRGHPGGVLAKYGGRSFCPKCKKPIAWYDNLPLVSFVALRGRCRQCHSPISRQYPLVELATGLAWVGVGWWWLQAVFFHLRGVPQAQHHLGGVFSQLGAFETMDLWVLPYYLVVVSGLIAVLVSDLIYLTIPDEALWVMGGAGVLFHLRGFSPPAAGPLNLGGGLVSGLSGAVAGVGAAAFFWFLHWITKGRGMGFGDVKLALVMGLILGFPGVVLALFIAFLTGAVVGVILILAGKKKFGQQVAFGPFLVLGTLAVLFFKESLWLAIKKVLL